MTEPTPSDRYLGTLAGQRYSDFTKDLHKCVVSFSDDSEKIETDDVAKILTDNVPLIEANSIGSRIVSTDWAQLQHQHKPWTRK